MLILIACWRSVASFLIHMSYVLCYNMCSKASIWSQKTMHCSLKINLFVQRKFAWNLDPRKHYCWFYCSSNCKCICIFIMFSIAMTNICVQFEGYILVNVSSTKINIHEKKSRIFLHFLDWRKRIIFKYTLAQCPNL